MVTLLGLEAVDRRGGHPRGLIEVSVYAAPDRFCFPVRADPDAAGRGIAYGTRDRAHLLNVPAGKMSAWPDRPDDFAAVIAKEAGARAGDLDAGRFYHRETFQRGALAVESQ